jgi:hypothetical protein
MRYFVFLIKKLGDATLALLERGGCLQQKELYVWEKFLDGLASLENHKDSPKPISGG